jgi:protein-L-isoaspartate(D-aspartate) O-methyltransferase
MFDPTQPDLFKQAVRASFDATLVGYGSHGDFHWQFARRLIDHAPLRAGDLILDIATGTAPAAIMAATQVGRQGFITGIDLSPGILALAQRNIAAAQLRNIALACGDAEHLPIRDGSVDGVLCSSAIVWFPNIPQALQEWHRVLRVGGWVAFSCFGGLARQTLIDLLTRLLTPYGQVLPELNAPLNTPEKCRHLLKSAGFADVNVQIANQQQLPATAEACFEWAWASRKRFGIDLPPAQRDQLMRQYLVEFALLATDQATWNHDYEQFVVAYK